MLIGERCVLQAHEKRPMYVVHLGGLRLVGSKRTDDVADEMEEVDEEEHPEDEADDSIASDAETGHIRCALWSRLDEALTAIGGGGGNCCCDCCEAT